MGNGSEIKSTRCNICARFDENKGHINPGIEEKDQHPKD
jgi:hypothetical protein